MLWNSPARDDEHLIRLSVLPRDKVLLIHATQLGLLSNGEMPQSIVLTYDDTLGCNNVSLDSGRNRVLG